MTRHANTTNTNTTTNTRRRSSSSSSRRSPPISPTGAPLLHKPHKPHKPTRRKPTHPSTTAATACEKDEKDWVFRQQTGSWTLAAGETHAGTYEFRPSERPVVPTTGRVPAETNPVRVLGELRTYAFRTPNSAAATQSTATVQVAKADVTATQFDGLRGTLFSTGIRIHVGSIAKDIHTAPRRGRQKVFVLPSQLNAAEYRGSEACYVVHDVNAYKRDVTGGPIGQLAADPGAAQFIIDNASNTNTSATHPPSNTGGDGGINYLSEMGAIDGLALVNGYLQVAAKTTTTTTTKTAKKTTKTIGAGVDVGMFERKLSRMTVMGMAGLAVRGTIFNGKRHLFQPPKRHVVDLVYASAVPVGQYGNGRTPAVKRIAELTLFAQYTAALRIAAARKNCDVYLMPLGGGVFGNTLADIANAMNAAFRTMEEALRATGCTVSVLAWERSSEPAFFEKLPKAP